MAMRVLLRRTVSQPWRSSLRAPLVPQLSCTVSESDLATSTASYNPVVESLPHSRFFSSSSVYSVSVAEFLRSSNISRGGGGNGGICALVLNSSRSIGSSAPLSDLYSSRPSSGLGSPFVGRSPGDRRFWSVSYGVLQPVADCISPSAMVQMQQKRSLSKMKKYKIKSYSSYKDRFRLLADGTYKRWRSGTRHNAHSKTAKQRRQLRRPSIAPAALAKVMKKLHFVA